MVKFNKKNLLFLLFLTIIVGFVYPLTSSAENETKDGEIIASTLNVREQPSLNSKVIGKLPKNTKVEIISTKNNWGKISFNNKTGYISLDYVEIYDSEKFITFNKKMSPKTERLNVREEPHLNSRVIKIINPNDTILIVEKNQKWGKFIENDKKMFVSLDFLTLKEEQKKEETVLNGKYKGKIIASTLNIRSQPNTNSSIIGKFIRNQIVDYEKTNNSWAKVSVNNNYGFISLDYVEEIKKETEKITKMSPTVTSLNVRSEPNTNSTILTTITPNDVIETKPYNEKWIRTVLNEKEAFVFSSFLKEIEKVKKDEPVETIEEKTKTGVVIASFLNVRSEPTTQSNVLDVLKNGEKIYTSKTIDGWSEIDFKNSNEETKKGYVSNKFIKFDENTEEETTEEETTEEETTEEETTEEETTEEETTEEETTEEETTEEETTEEETTEEETTEEETTEEETTEEETTEEETTEEETTEEETTEEETTEEDTSEKVIGRVTASNLNVREETNTSSKIIGKLPKNTNIEILEINDNWGKINFNEKVGFISMTYISFELNEEIHEIPKFGVVNAWRLNVRNGPSTKYEILTKISKGERVEIIEEVNDWYKIVLNDGVGFVSGSYITRTETLLEKDLTGKTIIIDVGHGGRDPGAVANGLKEKEIVLEVSLMIENYLKTTGANVILTRKTDNFLSLTERTRISNNSETAIFVSIHANGSEYESATGSETFYYPSSDDNLKKQNIALSQSIQRNILLNVPIENRGVKPQNFQVLRFNEKTSTLVELGFLTNSYDSSLLKQKEYKNRMAIGVTNGIIEYFDSLN